MACENSTGNGTTISFAVSTFTSRITVVNGLEEEVPVIEDDDISSTEMKYCKGDAPTVSPLDVEIYYSYPPPPFNQAPELITITYPDGSTLAGSGFCNARTGPTAQNNERMLGSFSIQFDNQATPVAYAAAP